MKINPTNYPSQVFVTGTDTGIGKTVVSAILAKGLEASYWKPIQAGLNEETDTQWVKQNAGLPDNMIVEERYRLSQPLSPHLAAAIDNVQISLSDFAMPQYLGKHLIIEGAGGIMVPINQKHYIADLIAWLEVPVILVARSTLGTINHTLLTLEKLKSMKIPVWGVVLNGKKNQENKKAIESFGQVRVIAEIQEINNICSKSLQTLYKEEFT